MEVSSKIERYLKTKVAKELLSKPGKVSVILIYVMTTIVALYGCSQVVVNFKLEFFVKPTGIVYNALKLNAIYFHRGA